MVWTQVVIRDLRHLDAPARNLETQRLARRRPLHLQQERGACLATQMTADEAHGLVCHYGIINLQDDVALLQPRFLGRHALVRLFDDDALQSLVVAYQCSDTGILACQHGLQLLLLLLGVVLRVGVQRLQHGVDTCCHHLVSIQRIDVHEVQVLVQGIEDVQVLGHLQIMVLDVLCR